MLIAAQRGGEIRTSTRFTSDLDISVDTEWIQGTEGFEYGILFLNSTQGQYGFGITATGGYIFNEWELPEQGNIRDLQTLIDWTFTNDINRRGKNTLRVVTRGSLFEVYINGNKVNSVTDGTLTEGTIGLYVAGLQEVAFDNLTVREIGGQPLLKLVTK